MSVTATTTNVLRDTADALALFEGISISYLGEDYIMVTIRPGEVIEIDAPGAHHSGGVEIYWALVDYDDSDDYGSPSIMRSQELVRLDTASGRLIAAIVTAFLDHYQRENEMLAS